MPGRRAAPDGRGCAPGVRGRHSRRRSRYRSATTGGRNENDIRAARARRSRRGDRGSSGARRRDAEDRRGQPAHRPAGRGRTLHRQRAHAREGRDQQGRRRARPRDRAAHRGQPEHEPGHRARVHEARVRTPGRGDRRSDLQHADPGGVAHDREVGHPDDDRRDRHEPHAHQQPLGVPGASERRLLVAGHGRLRHQYAEAAQVGDRAFDRCVRAGRHEGADRGTEGARRTARRRPSRSRSRSPARTSSAPTWRTRPTSRSSRSSSASSA